MDSLPQLGRTLLASPPVSDLPVEWPRYVRRCERRICHLGVGAFHRAHQAAYLHDLLQQGEADGWGICGIALRPSDASLFKVLHAQDGLYSLWETDIRQRRVRVIGSIMEFIDAIEDRAAAIAVLADAATHIVSLTITEAGNCLDRYGELDTQHPEIAHDLAHPDSPRSAPGVLVAALRARRAAGLGAFTLMSCDNLIGNGHRLRAAVCGLASRLDAGLADWIAQHASFPLSMVDRITPAAEASRNAQRCAEWGVRDAALVMCEGWRQWILEDRFVAGRPAFERVGAVFSSDVPAYETMKVSLLNGGHSAIAHLGLMLGSIHVHEAMANPLVANWLARYQREVASTLTAPQGVDLDDYARDLARRFSNPAIEDRLQRLAQDTSEKFRQALLPPLRHRLERGESVDALATAVALWLRYLAGLAEHPEARETYADTDRDRLIALASAEDWKALLSRVLPVGAAQAGTLLAAVRAQLASINRYGVEAHVAALR